MITADQFRKTYTRLILLAWLIPAMFGLSFIGYVEILTIDELIGIIITPTEPAFILLWLFFALWYFRRYIRPVLEYLEKPDKPNSTRALDCMRNYPLHFWLFFLLYLITAPASVILSAELFTDFVARPVDWFRIHLVALIVSIIVGLPIFFRMLDLFGKVVSRLELLQPHITIKTKVFLIGALVPLLIDTMIVQYYWTRTGFFTFETFTVWLFMELLAIGGSLIFVRSFGQSLSPLEELVGKKTDLGQIPTTHLLPQSTDEIGVLTVNFRNLLDELHEYRDHLEELVSNRTKELERLNRELEAFSYSVSHDLRTPLRAIDGFSQALMEDYADNLDDTGHDYLNRVRSASQTMAELIDDMLQLSRITRAELSREEVDLTDIAREAVESHKLAEPDRHINIVIAEDLTCYGDRKLITIMMHNLIGNAWKYTSKKNAAEIHVGIQQTEGEDVFFVQDNGAGFDMQFADKLFGVFQRLHSADEFPGSGVGLATVQRILNRHGGKIWAESTVDKGATFYFTL